MDLLRMLLTSTFFRTAFLAIPLGLFVIRPSFSAISLTYTYDPLGRLIQVGAVGGYDVAYAHDNAGNRTSTTVSAGADGDGDGLSDFEELYVHSTNAAAADTDADGLNDGEEVITYMTDPTLWDTDGDGYSDKAEIDTSTDPLDAGSFPLPSSPNYLYTVLNPELATGDAGVVSLADGNTIIAGTTVLPLNRNEWGVIPAGTLVQGLTVTGSGPFDIGSSINATDMPLPARMAGTRFVMPQWRYSHFYYLLSPNGDANVSLDVGGVVTNVTLPEGQVVEVDGGGNNGVSAVIVSDVPILAAHRTDQAADASPVPPAALEIWGVRTNNAAVGALEDDTRVTIYADNGDIVEDVILDAGTRYNVNIGGNGSEGAGSALRVVADKPVGAVQIADSDGTEQTAFMPTVQLAARFGLPTNAQYVAVVCPQPDTTVTLHAPPNAPDARDCGGDGVYPGKLRFGSGTDGVHIAAGAYLESNEPVYVIYEDAATNDEHNLAGYLPSDNRYWVLNPGLETGKAGVTSLSDDNLIVSGSAVLQLGLYEHATLPAGSLSSGQLIDGSGPFDIGSAINATDLPMSQAMLGRQFVMPQIRNSHLYYLLSPHGDAIAQVDVAGTVTDLDLPRGKVVELDAGDNNSISVLIASDLPILVSHRNSANGDASPVPPAATEIWGVRSTGAYIGALEDNTTISIYADSGAVLHDVVLNGGDRYTVGTGSSSSQGAGSGLRIVSDKPIGGIQHADGDGGEQTAFLPTAFLSSSFGIPTDSQYVAVVCSQADTTVTLYDGVSPPDARACGGDGTLPGKLHFGATASGVHVGAGAILGSDKPIYVIYEDSVTNDEHNLLGNEPSDYQYRILDPDMASGETAVVSLVDGNTIVSTDSVLALARHQRGIIPAGELQPGALVSGSGPFDIGGSVSGTDVPLHSSLAGQRFVAPHVRYGHVYHLLSPNGDATAKIDVGGAITPVALPQGEVVTVNAGSNNSVSAVIESDLPILVAHRADNGNDGSPIPPAALEVWGVRSNGAYVGATENDTRISLYASDGSLLQDLILNAGDRHTVATGSAGSQGTGSALRIVADKPIGAVQSADGDGGEQTAFMPTAHLASRFAIPTDAQYVAAVCPEPDTTVTLYDPPAAPDARVCGGAGVAPGKLYFGSTTNGANIGAGAYLESNRPIHLIYEDAASNDEHNLTGSR